MRHLKKVARLLGLLTRPRKRVEAQLDAGTPSDRRTSVNRLTRQALHMFSQIIDMKAPI
jgi:hypothetical protein